MYIYICLHIYTFVGEWIVPNWTLPAQPRQRWESNFAGPNSRKSKWTQPYLGQALEQMCLTVTTHWTDVFFVVCRAFTPQDPRNKSAILLPRQWVWFPIHYRGGPMADLREVFGRFTVSSLCQCHPCFGDPHGDIHIFSNILTNQSQKLQIPCPTFPGMSFS